MEKAKEVCKKLQDRGFKAVLCGGCVRDSIIGHEPKDIDIATNATPKEVSKVFNKTLEIGKAFGVTFVIYGGNQYEVATFRSDGQYSDNRRPDSVTFGTMEDDSIRRDFTMNGLFQDPVHDLIHDFVGGQRDIDDQIINCVGNADERFLEDPLRMLRAIRFACQLGWSIDWNTLGAIEANHHKIRFVSKERVRDELKKMLIANPEKAIGLMSQTGLLAEILPEVSQLYFCNQNPTWHPEGNALDHTMLCLKCLTKDASFELIFATLLHDIGKYGTTEVKNGRITNHGHAEKSREMADKVCRRLKLTNIEKEKVCDLVGRHMVFFNIKKMKKAKLKRLFASDNFSDLMSLYEADCLGSNGDMETYNYCVVKQREFANEPMPVKHKVCTLINGNDLIDMGWKPGPEFKEILEETENARLEGKINTKAEAMVFVTEVYG